ncbi:ImmA/IrrE family metallo-endopeptidase [Yimella sp. cx-51]|uniref:ImmA/IrrE family metallo-endopeptidase n=1 Tax=Yimella sp. cx-51 TaxID=2770551 RepID=UPI00165E215D|nr:ImmA/IrrE family metallo-endopeptidase [Yimella sp. cx-51]MBC9958362.1 ImmA/IrrE family metallo-endopeptidase [Yimella sp. cx-51]QTH39745.1 ImmA/IrrE family metallo-endopeptidase [Yimella sp. cx-51]
MSTIDHKATRKAIVDQAAQFIADPAGWPAAMAARALRLRMGHPPYSPTNHTLIVAQLMARFVGSGMDTETAFHAAIRAAAEEVAPRHIWVKRGYTVTAGAGLSVWSKPIPLWIDPSTGQKCTKDTPGAIQRRVFRLEQTYRAADVTNNETGETGETAFSAPELPAGEAREIFQRLADWITGQGWTVERTGRDMPEGGYTAHGTRQIVVHGGLAGWAAVETLTHEIAHALLHGADDERPYAGEHRGDMEAEAEAVAFGLLTAYDQGDLARGSARYVAEWTRNPERVATAYERSCHVLDAVAAVAAGAEGVEVARSAKAEKAATKATNKELAAALREAGLEPKGEAWARAKAGEPVEQIAADLADAA